MSGRIEPREITDWTKLNENEDFWKGIDLSRPEHNFGIHEYNSQLWTSGFVGVGRIFDKNGWPIKTQGRDYVVVIRSSYGMDPWNMLEKVMTDEEYEGYQEELQRNNKYLFRVFYDQPLIKLAQDQRSEDDILFALSFINACYSLCKKGIKKKMLYQEENFNAKIRGKIDVKKNIRMNTSHGRNERFYCKYIDFTADNTENRILKAALTRCRKIVEQKFELHVESVRRMYYCLNILRGVKNVQIKNKDFNSVSVTGLYTYYKPLLRQAKSILGQKYHSVKGEDGRQITKSIYTIPYMINMETLFEFYVRTVLKEVFRGSKYVIQPYSGKLFLEKGIGKEEDSKKGAHLMPYCIPDIIVRDVSTGEIAAVLDAKYKAHERAARSDSLQLLSYVLLTGSNRCGFVFPESKTELKQLRKKEYMVLETPLISQLRYFELLMGNVIDKDEMMKIFL